jgi:hypothetical protein
MSGRGGCEDKRIARTVGYLLPCPRSSVLEAMQAFKFSDEESEDAVKQMVVRRRRPAWREMRGGVNDAKRQPTDDGATRWRWWREGERGW